MNIPSFTPFNSVLVTPKATHVTNLDTNSDGFASSGEILRSGGSVLETAEPNAPSVDRFDANSDGFVTIYDINNSLGPVGDTDFITDAAIRQGQSEDSTSPSGLSSTSEQNSAVDVFQSVQSENDRSSLFIDFYI